MFGIIKNAANAAANIMNKAADKVEGAAKTINKTLDKIESTVKDINFDDFSFDSALELLDTGMKRGLGGVVNMALDKMGLPDVVGDVVGTALSVVTGDIRGVILNGADALSDVAKATGHEKIAGFIDAALPILDTVSGIATQVALTAATAGAAAPVSIGGLTLNVATIIKGAELVKTGLEVGSAIQNGDWMGAAKGLLSGVGTLAGIGGDLGMAADVIDKLTTAADYGAKALPVIQNVMADGKLDLSDLQHVPLNDILQAAGVNTAGKEDMIQGLLSFGAGVISGQPPMDSVSGLLTSLIGQVAPEQAQQIDFIKDLIMTGMDKPDMLELLSSILSQTLSTQKDVDLHGQLASFMRM